MRRHGGALDSNGKRAWIRGLSVSVPAIPAQSDSVQDARNAPRHEGDIGRPGLVGAHRRDSAESPIAAGLILARQQLVIPRAGRQKGIAFVELEARAALNNHPRGSFA